MKKILLWLFVLSIITARAQVTVMVNQSTHVLTPTFADFGAKNGFTGGGGSNTFGPDGNLRNLALTNSGGSWTITSTGPQLLFQSSDGVHTYSLTTDGIFRALSGAGGGFSFDHSSLDTNGNLTLAQAANVFNLNVHGTTHQLFSDGTGSLAFGNITFDANGNITSASYNTDGSNPSGGYFDIGAGANTVAIWNNSMKLVGGTISSTDLNALLSSGVLPVPAALNLLGSTNILGSGMIGAVPSTNYTLDFPSTAGSSSSTLTATVAGVGTNGDWQVMVTCPTLAINGITNYTLRAEVTATNTITVMFGNNNAVTAIDPPSCKYRLTPFRFSP